MKITVLDVHTLNPGDWSWDPLENLGEVTVYDRSAPEEVVVRCADADIILTNKALVKDDAIRELKDLKYIGVIAHGYNVVDVKAAADRGLPVTNAAGYSRTNERRVGNECVSTLKT